MTTLLNVSGEFCRELHRFSDRRALVDYAGGVVLVDATSAGWELSGEPATDEERAVMNAILAPEMETTVVTVTK